jgi:hypothetical protein
VRKPFCDICKKECVNVTIRIRGEIEHTTNQAEIVGEDDLPGKDLCRDCGDPILKLLSITPIPREFRDLDVAPPIGFREPVRG